MESHYKHQNQPRHQEDADSVSSSPFHQLVPDCRELIFSFHLHEIWDSDLPSRETNHPTPESTSQFHFALQNFKCQANLEFLREKDLPLLSNLYSLILLGGCNPDAIDIFSHFQNLVELQIYGYNTLSDEMFRHLESLQVLEMKYVAEEAYYDFSDGMFSHLKNLRHLKVMESNVMTDRAMQNLYDAGCKLESLVILKCQRVTDRVFTPMKGQTLRNLTLCECDRITGEGLQLIRGVERLELIDMGNLYCEAFKCLRGSVQHLRISNCNISSIDEEAMSCLKGISSLQFHQCGIDLKDSLFQYLIGSIKKLEVIECFLLGDVSKDALWCLSGIEQVTLHHTRIRIEGEEDLVRLKEVFQKVTICKLESNFADESTLEELRQYIEGNGGMCMVYMLRERNTSAAGMRESMKGDV